MSMTLPSNALNSQDSTNDTPPRFIRLQGIPHLTSEGDTALHSPNAQPSIQTSPIAEVIPSSPTLNPTTTPYERIVDLLPATTLDPFTLEPFEESIRDHANQNKTFVLARVTTQDSNDEEKFYYSYYQGHQINKVLFRTQPELGFLHRMKARNPLNNMVIVGDVYYYTIAPEDALKALQELDRRKPQEKPVQQSTWPRVMDYVRQSMDKPGHVRSISQASRPSMDSKRKVKWIAQPLDDFTGIAKAPMTKEEIVEERIQRSSFESINSQASFNRKLLESDRFSLDEVRTHSFGTVTSVVRPQDVWTRGQLIPSCNRSQEQSLPPPLPQPNNSSNLSKKRNKSDLDLWVDTDPIYFYAQFFATDDDFLMSSQIRSFFKANALESDDGQLFTLFEQGNQPTSPDEMSPHPALPGYHITVDTSSESSSTIRSRKRFPFVARAALLGLIIAILIAIRFIVPGLADLVYGLIFVSVIVCATVLLFCIL